MFFRKGWRKKRPKFVIAADDESVQQVRAVDRAGELGREVWHLSPRARQLTLTLYL